MPWDRPEGSGRPRAKTFFEGGPFLPEFCHLHCHSEMSLLDGMSRVKEIPKRAKELGMEAVALTDHGVLYGAVDFYKACLEEGVRPILGVEGYLARRTMHDREPKLDESPYHMLLLAESSEGYKNLVKLVSDAWTDGFYYRPRMDKELLAQNAKGIIATSGCISAEIPSLILAGREKEAWDAAGWYRDVFGRENFFLEIMDHGMPEEKKVARSLIAMAKDLGLGLVATQDAHYLRREDARAHDVLLCIQTGKTVSQTDRMKYPNDLFYLRSPEEMGELFKEVPEALQNTVNIARRCEADPGLGGSYLPTFVSPNGKSPDAVLRDLTRERLPGRYPEPTPEVRDRLAYELSVIEKMGFESYFLITFDFIDFARRQGIAVGPGRGSAAGSLVAYILGITDIDPIQYRLLFERFLNPERVTPPDIDIDFDYNRRDEVIAYVTEKYGADRVAHIITFGTMAAKAALRDVARAMELPYAEADRLAKLVPNELGITLERALEASEELGTLARTNARVQEVVDLARSVEGMPRHASVHAAGIVIASFPLTDLVPLQKMNDGTVVTQFPMTTLEEMGLLKMDFLGLRTLTVIEETLRLVRSSRGLPLDLSQIAWDDQETFRLLAQADTFGIFQMESQGMRQMLRDLVPSHIEDVIAAVSLYRPGPMENIPLFIRQKKAGKATYLHPDLEPILKDTYGVIVYQEQVMEVAATMAGYSLGQADLLRRAMGKKKAELLRSEKEHFVKGCMALGRTEKVATELFELILKFANYGFNRAHGAAYGVLAYETAYLKAHYTAEYLAAHLTSLVADSEKVSEGLLDAQNHELLVLAPDVNRSQAAFSVEEGQIRVGLMAVKNLGAQAAEAITQGAPYTSFFDFVTRQEGLNRRAVESLAKSGALDAFGNRRALLQGMGPFMDEAQRRRRKVQDGQLSLFAEEEMVSPEPILPVVSPEESAVRLQGEQEALGFFLSGHPLDPHIPSLEGRGIRLPSQLGEAREGAPVKTAGVLSRVRKLTTRRGEPMARIAFSDRYGEANGIVFPKAMRLVAPFLEVGLPVLMEGRLEIQEEGPTVIVESMGSLVAEPELLIRRGSLGREEILSLLASYPGRAPVVFEDEGGRRPLPVRVDVTNGFLREALAEALGPEGFLIQEA